MAGLTTEQQQQVLELLNQLSGPAPTTNTAGQSVQQTPTGDIPAGATLLGTFADNGRIYQKPDGSLGAVSAGMATNDQQTIARIMEGMTPAQATRESWQDSAIQENPFLARASTALQGAPFMGGWTDEIAGMAGGETANRSMDYLQTAMNERKPLESLGLQLGTGIAAGLPMLAAAVPYVASGTGLAGQALRGGLLGAIGGGAEGAVNGAGREQGGRVLNSLINGGWGASIGGLLGVAGPLVGRGIENMMTPRGTVTMNNAAQDLGVSPQAAGVVARALDADDATLAAANINTAGRTGMLADSGPVSQGVLDAVTQTPGAAMRTTRGRVDGRLGDVLGDVTQGMDDTLGAPQGLISVEEAIRSNAAPEIRDAYARAYATPIDYSAPQGAAIEDILTRIPAKTARTAITRANERMAWNGANTNQIMASIADDGSVVYQEMPNVEQLDQIKRAFDSIARDGTDPVTGKLTSEAEFASQIARAVRNATRDAVPAYGDALELASDSLTQQAAVDFGASILQPNAVTREQVQRAVKDATAPELQAMRLALRSQIDERIANARAVASDPNLDSRQLRESLNILGSEAAATKIRTLLGDDADFLLSNIAQAQAALGVKASVTTNSRTFGRGIVNEMITQANEPGPLVQMAQGRGIDATQQIVQEITGFTRDNMNARSQAVMNEVADVLTRSGNVDAMAALRLLQQASATRPITDKQAYQIASAVGKSLGLGVYQQATQRIASETRGLLQP